MIQIFHKINKLNELINLVSKLFNFDENYSFLNMLIVKYLYYYYYMFNMIIIIYY